MKRINLSTNDVFVKNGQRIRILTEGIDTTERFDDNPIMLFDHNTQKVLGIWESIERDEDRISALPMFDDDSFSIDIGNKMKKGTLKSASIGIEIKDAFLDGDVLTVSKSMLLEASIVGIPANVNAKTVDFSKGSIMLFSNGEEIDPDDYIKKINNMKKDKTENPEIKDLEVKVEEVKVTELETLQASLTEKETLITELNSKVEDFAAGKVELNLNVTDLNKEVEELKSKNEELTLSVTDKDSKIEELNGNVLEMKNEKIDFLLNSAISEGKITKEAKEDFAELSYDKAKSILDKIMPSDVSLMDTLNLNKGKEDKTYDWYLKNDKTGLRKLSKENPTLYKQLEKNYTK